MKNPQALFTGQELFTHVKSVNFSSSITLYFRPSLSTSFHLSVIILVLNTIIIFPTSLLIHRVKNHRVFYKGSNHDRGNRRLCHLCSVIFRSWTQQWSLSQLLVFGAPAFIHLIFVYSYLLPPASKTQSQLVEKKANFISIFSLIDTCNLKF